MDADILISAFSNTEKDSATPMYGKQTERAIAAMSRLAEVWDGGVTRLSAIHIADNRGLPRPMVAKLLTILSQARLVSGSPGPGGGYALAREPAEISLADVYRLFERDDTSTNCPFGGGVCGIGDPCALHHCLVDMQASVQKLLTETTFEVFLKAAQDGKLTPAQANGEPPPRQSWRAPLKRRS
jgi:Rrf2 family protein